MASKKGTIRVGVGGWTYEDWRGPFYPEGLAQKRELEYASRKLSTIEINGTFYGSQKPESFAKWHAETPDDFVFALKGPRFATNRKVLGQAGESIERFLASGLTELKDKLGPINWQFADSKRFEPGDFEAFLTLLPKSIDGRRLMHAVEPRHETFQSSEFIQLARKYEVAVVIDADGRYPQIAAMTAPFVYARIMGTKKDQDLGYSNDALDSWAEHARTLAAGSVPDSLAATYASQADPIPRDVFLYVISGFKEKNPAAAMALIERLG